MSYIIISHQYFSSVCKAEGLWGLSRLGFLDVTWPRMTNFGRANNQGFREYFFKGKKQATFLNFQALFRKIAKSHY
jgi:hypothetical protein